MQPRVSAFRGRRSIRRNRPSSDDGLAGLVPHKRGPKQAHKLTEEVLTFIGEVRQKEPSMRLPELVKRIQKRFGTKVHPRSIERSLLRHQKKPAERGRR